MRARISRTTLEQIMTAAAVSGEEICGLLLGEGMDIAEVHPAPNVAADRARHFEIDPATLIAAHRAAREGGASVLGHYHSHPSGIALPSATDVASASPDGSLWLIVGGGQATLWRAEAGEAGKVRFASITLDSR
ncbi:MAG: peptidase [Sphingobium sp.]|uniref:M67 family metallopeptidase n=1 Tax=Sphingobium sp. TaxID=1912891 RepID=UPI000DB330C2|nr:M67 family metallopeptidase [Sphingobium sp.]PZU09483.1 MAG: peptidase [Sphingobium sp.]